MTDWLDFDYCRICGKPIWAEPSLTRGIGPVCYATLQDRLRHTPDDEHQLSLFDDDDEQEDHHDRAGRDRLDRAGAHG